MCDESKQELPSGVHDELTSLYQTAQKNIEFAKNQQWRILNYNLLVYAAFAVLAHHIPEKFRCSFYWLTGITAVLGLILLITFQLWMTNEREIIDEISQKFSEQFREIRGTKSAAVRNLGNWFTLGVMFFAVIVGATITIIAIMYWDN